MGITLDMPPLGPEQGYIFRIAHVDNMPWILDHGLHCRNAGNTDPNFVPIGMQELIDKRSSHQVPIAPHGTLADYVPFYFTPHSMMLLNIKTGYNGVIKRSNDEIIILVSTLPTVAKAGAKFVFTNGHAYMTDTNYYDDLARLDKIDWDILKRRDFKKSPDDIDKSRRYQAEALIYRHLPTSALKGIACYNKASADRVAAEIDKRGLALQVRALPSWYF
jgi:hypothetical protein